MTSPNYLLGFGQRLSRSISLKTGGGSVRYPWSFQDARKKLSPQWNQTVKEIQSLPKLACPEGQTVISCLLHPNFLARSHYPIALLEKIDLRPVGSRSKRIKLDSEKDYNAPELFIRGLRTRIIRFGDQLPNWRSTTKAQDDLRKVLQVASLDHSRLKPIAQTDVENKLIPLEVVLHASDSEDDDFIVSGFRDYARHFDIEVDLDRRIHVGGLCFLPLYAPVNLLENLTDYSFVRVVRRMPTLSLNESVVRTASIPGGFSVKLPDKDALSKEVSVAVFDGGIPRKDTQLARWVTPHDGPGVGAPSPTYEAHGLAVTSALLFGPLERDVTPPTPFANVHHWRVLDRSTRGDDFELLEVLRRILNVLRQRKYDFVSLSIGPCIPIEDNDVHVWTSALDNLLWSSGTVLTAACGNTGEDDWKSGNARIQPSSDGVNP